jgi:hypothetical protein
MRASLAASSSASSSSSSSASSPASASVSASSSSASVLPTTAAAPQFAGAPAYPPNATETDGSESLPHLIRIQSLDLEGSPGYPQPGHHETKSSAQIPGERKEEMMNKQSTRRTESRLVREMVPPFPKPADTPGTLVSIMSKVVDAVQRSKTAQAQPLPCSHPCNGRVATAHSHLPKMVSFLHGFTLPTTSCAELHHYNGRS